MQNRRAKPAAKPRTLPAEKPKIKPLASDRLAEPDFGWRSWEATIQTDTPREALLDGKFWRLCSPRVRRGDHILWRSDSLTAFGELVVVACDNATGSIEVRELWAKEIAGATVQETEQCGFTPTDLGMHDGWGILRDADGHLMQKNLRSYAEAMRRIRTEHIPSQAARVAKGGIR